MLVSLVYVRLHFHTTTEMKLISDLDSMLKITHIENISVAKSLGIYIQGYFFNFSV